MIESYVFEWWHIPLFVAAYGLWFMFWEYLGSLVRHRP